MKKLDFKPYIQIYLDEQNFSVKLNRPYKDQNKMYCFKLTETGFFIFKNIDGIKTRSEIKRLALEKFPHSEHEIDEIFELLFKENYIEEIDEQLDEKYKELNREFGRIIPIWSNYESKNLNRYQIQKLIMEKRVGIIGCGTIGFGIVSDLVSAGIGKFVLFDKDVVELSNLSRQPLFQLNDVGKPKVNVLKNFIENRRTNANVQIKEVVLTTEDDLQELKDVDIIIVSADHPSYEELARLVQNFGLKNNIAISFAGGYKANQGRIYPLFIPNKSYCFNCLANYLNKKVTMLGKRLYNRQIVISSNAQMGKFISSVVSSEILKYLSGVIDPYVINQFLSINFLNYEFEKHPFIFDDECQYCKNIEGDFN